MSDTLTTLVDGWAADPTVARARAILIALAYLQAPRRILRCMESLISNMEAGARPPVHPFAGKREWNIYHCIASGG